MAKQTDLKPAAKEDAISAKLAAIRAENEEAQKAIAAYFGAERWAKIQSFCSCIGLSTDHVASTCGKATRITREIDEYRVNDAAKIAAAIHFLCLVGSKPKASDQAALEAALKQPSSLAETLSPPAAA